MMLFYPPYPPQWFGPMLVTEFQEIESGHCYRSGLFVQSCKMLFRHWFSLYLFVLQANYQYILKDTKVMHSQCCPHEDLASKSLLVGHGQTPELRYFLFFTNRGPARFQPALSKLIKNRMFTC